MQQNHIDFLHLVSLFKWKKQISIFVLCIWRSSSVFSGLFTFSLWCVFKEAARCAYSPHTGCTQLRKLRCEQFSCRHWFPCMKAKGRSEEEEEKCWFWNIRLFVQQTRKSLLDIMFILSRLCRWFNRLDLHCVAQWRLICF